MTMRSVRKYKGCSRPSPQLVQRLNVFEPSRTDKALSARFGISYGTWRKLTSGEPIRTSLIERLEKRVGHLEAWAGCPK